MTIRPFAAHAAHAAHLAFASSLALALIAVPAAAQPVYKCTSDGKISYGQVPCSGGITLALEPVPVPNQAAPRRADALRLQADQLTDERHRREAADERVAQRAAKAAARQRDNCARLKLQKKWADEDATQYATHDATRNAARARHPDKATLKAHRAAEKFALACPH